MRSLVRDFFADRSLPHHLPIASRKSHDHKLVRNAWLDASARLMRRVSGHADGYRRHEVDAVPPDNGRSTAASRNLDLPFDVLCLAPFERRIGGLRNSCSVRSTPLPPKPLG